MAKIQSKPNLPAASRMQSPSSSSKSAPLIKEKGGMKGSKGATKKVMASAKGKGMAKKSY
jgi:hypothetical protein